MTYTHPSLSCILLFTMSLAEYHRVLQEESERVCGRALPPELIRLILYKWGGFEHPAAEMLRRCMSDVGPRRSRWVEAASLPMVHLRLQRQRPSAPSWTRRVVGWKLSGEVYHHTYDSDAVETGTRARSLLFQLLHTGVPERWKLACECSGVPSGWLPDVWQRSMMPSWTIGGIREAYRLLLRAENPSREQRAELLTFRGFHTRPGPPGVGAYMAVAIELVLRLCEWRHPN